ncbi:MAG: helix-turn-helix domain-containing protein [Chloroflexi bacterium]|nr:helix-turn-helix domain-containing protein [Chloroflexota bacterium]
MDYEHDAVSVDVGQRLKELREERRMSIRGLATRSGLSANALSMIERGKTSPSVSTLYKLSDALGVPITEFFGTKPEKQSAILIKADGRTRVPFARGVWEGLGGEHFTGRVEPFILTLESGATSGPHNMTHSGHEFVYCLRGHLEYLVEKQVYLLDAGDSLLFAANLNHRWRNPGNVVTNVLIVLSGFSEGELPHAMHWRKGE